MKNNILVSVIVTIYNKEKTLKRAIESIINQKYSNIEIILVNDGSKDSSVLICNEYKILDKRVSVINKENEGQVLARKTGLKNAKGEYIVFVDADDWIDDRMIQDMLFEALNNDVDLVSCSWILHGTNGDLEEIDEVPEGIYFSNDEKRELAKYTFFDKNKKRVMNDSLNTKLYKKELIERCLMPFPEDIVYAEDTFVAFTCFALSKKTVIKKDCYYHYVTLDSSINRASNINVLCDLNKGYVYALELIDNNKLFDVYKCQLERILLYYMFYGVNEFMGLNEHHKFVRHFFPIDSIPVGSVIAIYGAGKVGHSYYNQLKKLCKIAYWVDKNESKGKGGNEALVSIESVDINMVDYVVIAIKDEIVSGEIKDELVNGFKWPAEKILWREPQSIFDIILAKF